MKYNNLTRVMTGLCLTAGLLLGASAGPAAAADAWIKAESEHFVIYSSAPEKKTRAYVKKIEAFRTLTNLLLGSEGGPQVKFEIWLLNNPDHIQVVRPSFSKNVAGVYFNCAEGTSAYTAVQTGGDMLEDQDQSLVVLFHEYAHYVMFQHAKAYYPAWYVEGFADYLSTADPIKGTITIGEESKMRAWTLGEDRWIGFDKVLNPDFGFAGDKKNDQWEIHSFYAQSWLLTHYMLSDPARAKALNAYFALVAKGGEPVKSWETATDLKVNELHTTLSRYRQKMVYYKLPVPDYADSAIQVTKLPAELNDLQLSRSLLTTCPPADQGKAILAKLTAQKASLGGNVDFRLALARAQLLYGKPEEAEGDLGTLVDTVPDNFDANYLLGRVYFQESDTAKGQERNDLIDAARGFFMAAYRINKLNAPNFYYLARSFSNKPGFPDQNAVNAANGAHVLAPGVPDYAVFAAFTNLATGKRDEAVALLTPFVSNPHDRESAERFQKAIDAIKAGKTTNQVMSLLGSGM